jgi:N-acetylneuraminic acid mutarotase
LYVGFGFCWNYRRDMFRYTITDNRWDSIDVGVSFSGYPTRSFGGTGCTCGGRHFMGTGYHRFSLDWWAELVDGTHWEARATVPGRTRTTAASGASADAIYLCGGFHYGGVTTTGEVLQDMLRYNPQEDRWHYIAVMPKRLMNHICFAIGDRVYFGLGEDDEWRLNDKLYYLED